MSMHPPHTSLSVLSLLALSALGCEPSATTLSGVISSAASGRASHMELALVRSCDGRDATSTPSDALERLLLVRPQVRVESARLDLAAGTYGLVGRAWDEQCELVAAGCAEVSLRAGGGVATVELLTASGRVCEPASCAAGVCGAARDAGPDASTDAGGLDASVDSGPDGGPDGGSDAGPDPGWTCPPTGPYVTWTPHLAGTVNADGLVRFPMAPAGSGCRFDTGAIGSEAVAPGASGEVIFQLTDPENHYFVGLSDGDSPSSGETTMFVALKHEGAFGEGEHRLVLSRGGSTQQVDAPTDSCVRLLVTPTDTRVEVLTPDGAYDRFDLPLPAPTSAVHPEVKVYGDCAVPTEDATRAWLRLLE